MNIKRNTLSFIKKIISIIFLILLVYIIYNSISSVSKYKEYMTNTLPGGSSPELSDKEEKLTNHHKAPYYTHPFTSASSGMKLLDNKPETDIKSIDRRANKIDARISKFTKKLTCYPSITGVFEDCGPLAYNGCSGLNPPIKNYRNHNQLNN